MIRDSLNRVLAAVTALALIAVAALTLLHVVTTLLPALQLRFMQDLLERSAGLAWADPGPQRTGAVMLVVGLIILVLQIPGRQQREASLATPTGSVSAQVTATLLRRRIEDLVGSDRLVLNTTVRGDARKIRVTIRVAERHRGMGADIRNAIVEHLSTLHLTDPPKVTVDVTRTKELS